MGNVEQSNNQQKSAEKVLKDLLCICIVGDEGKWLLLNRLLSPNRINMPEVEWEDYLIIHPTYEEKSGDYLQGKKTRLSNNKLKVIYNSQVPYGAYLYLPLSKYFDRIISRLAREKIVAKIVIIDSIPFADERKLELVRDSINNFESDIHVVFEGDEEKWGATDITTKKMPLNQADTEYKKIYNDILLIKSNESSPIKIFIVNETNLYMESKYKSLDLLEEVESRIADSGEFESHFQELIDRLGSDIQYVNTIQEFRRQDKSKHLIENWNEKAYNLLLGEGGWIQVNFRTLIFESYLDYFRKFPFIDFTSDIEALVKKVSSSFDTYMSKIDFFEKFEIPSNLTDYQELVRSDEKWIKYQKRMKLFFEKEFPRIYRNFVTKKIKRMKGLI